MARRSVSATAGAHPLPDSFNPVEMALDAEAAAGRAGPESPAVAVLIRQAKLLDIQIASERVGMVLKALAGAAGVIAALALGALVWSAANERGLVVEAFSVPPDYAQKGLTGQVLAARILDKLSEMQAGTASSRAAGTYANSWNGDIKVEIPQTGISVGELRRLLVEWLGHQTAISGELYRSPDGGIVLSARTGTQAASVHTGADADLDALITAAAEDIYATTQPYRYAVYLMRTGDPAKVERARLAMQRLTTSDDPIDRVWAYAGLARILQSQGKIPEALAAARRGAEQAPDFTLTWGNRAAISALIGHDEEALAAARKAVTTIDSHGRRYLQPKAVATIAPQWRAIVAQETGDFAGAAAAFEQSQRQMADPFVGANWAATLIAAHDLPAARRVWATVSATPGLDPALPAAFDAAIAAALEDWAGVERALGPAAGEARSTRDIFSANAVEPVVAIARARLGDFAGAEEAIGFTALDCYPCVAARGAVAAIKGDNAAADRWFARAVALGPSLPAARLMWAQALLERGDAKGAAEQARQAAAKGPRNADAQAVWGEALLKLGDAKGAEAKLRQAVALAPRWGRAHLLLGEALMALGKADQARSAWATARGLELTPTERLRLSKGGR